MSYVNRVSVTVVTGRVGDATAYTDQVNGLLSQVRYVKADFADGVDFTITVDETGEILWDEDNVNASATRAPRQATCDTVGVASLYAVAGEPVEDKIAVAGRIKIVIAAGGDTKTGAFHFVLV